MKLKYPLEKVLRQIKEKALEGLTDENEIREVSIAFYFFENKIRYGKIV